MPVRRSRTDANGNRTNATINAQSTTYTYPSGSHRLTSLSGAVSRTFTYDNAGDVIGTGGVTFTYDGRARLKQAGTTTFAVNGLGQRVRKMGSAETCFAYDEAGHLIGEYDSTGAAVTETLWLGDTPVAVLKTSGAGFDVYYVWSDRLNTPRLITDAANQSRWEWPHNDPFGNNLPNENPSGQGQFAYNLRFPGQYYDAETGTHYNYFRDYDPSIGRYTQSDLVGLAAGANTYLYVGASPLSYRDPFGLFQWPSIPQPALDFATGIADAASLGIGPLARRALNVGGGVNVCSGAYTAGQYASLFLGVGRAAYMGIAKSLPRLVAQEATQLDSALAMSAARNTLKRAARLGTFPDYRIYSAEQMLAKYGTDPAAIATAATRTNALVDAIGIDLATGATVGRMTCECQ